MKMYTPNNSISYIPTLVLVPYYILDVNRDSHQWQEIGTCVSSLLHCRAAGAFPVPPARPYTLFRSSFASNIRSNPSLLWFGTRLAQGTESEPRRDML